MGAYTASDGALRNGLRLPQNVQFEIKTTDIDLWTPVRKFLVRKLPAIIRVPKQLVNPNGTSLDQF